MDIENGVLRIPREESSKNVDNWIVGLSQRTTSVLAEWLEERKTYPKYDDTDALWSTWQANPYQSATLRYLLHRLA